MDQNENLEFSLEDILEEFGNHEPPSESPEPEAAPVYQPVDEPEEEVTGDTIRLDKIQEAVSAIPATPLDEGSEDAPVHVEEDEPAEASVEPFSEEWEPEYEEPMGDYPIPEPIVFRPKSRLKELRAKLVAGPEQRYYTLSELGVGKLQAAIFLSFLLFLFSAGLTALYAWGSLPESRLRLVVFVQFFAMLLAALLGCYRLIEGVGDMVRLRFTPNSLMVITFALCCLDGVLCLQQLRIPCCAAFTLEMTMALWATYHRRHTEIGQMDTLRRATTLDSIAAVADCYEGHTGFRTGRGEVEHFMDNYNETTGPDRLLNWYALSVVAASLIIGVLGGIRHGFSAGVQVAVAALLVGMPATAFICTSRPMDILEKRLHKLGTVLCGWKGMQATAQRSVFALEDEDLFPSGAAKLNGVKFYGDREPDQVVSYAAALIRENGGALVNVFTQLRDSRGGYPYAVENLNTYSGGGIGGEIDDDAVLVGSLQFMQDMGVDMGEGTRVNQAVYCAIDGELCGVFAVTYGKSKSSLAGVRTLCGYRWLTPVMATEDFMLTESFLRSKFGINTRRVAFPDRDARKALTEKHPEETDTVVALTTREGLAPKAYAIAGARLVKSTMKTGVIVHMVGGILGLLIMAALAYVGGTKLLTPDNVLLYELIWMVPGLLITEWARTV